MFSILKEEIKMNARGVLGTHEYELAYEIMDGKLKGFKFKGKGKFMKAALDELSDIIAEFERS